LAPGGQKFEESIIERNRGFKVLPSGYHWLPPEGVASENGENLAMTDVPIGEEPSVALRNAISTRCMAT
jgi:hypothetical protein